MRTSKPKPQQNPSYLAQKFEISYIENRCYLVPSSISQMQEHHRSPPLIIPSDQNVRHKAFRGCNLFKKSKQVRTNYTPNYHLSKSSLFSLLSIVILVLITTTINPLIDAISPLASHMSDSQLQSQQKTQLDSETINTKSTYLNTTNISSSPNTNKSLEDVSKQPSLTPNTHQISSNNNSTSNLEQPNNDLNTTTAREANITAQAQALNGSRASYGPELSNQSITNSNETATTATSTSQYIPNRKLPIIIPEHTDEILDAASSFINNVEDLEPTNQSNFDVSAWPRSDRHYVMDFFNEFFSKPRSHDDQQTKAFVRDGVVLKLKELGFDTSFIQKSRFEVRRRITYSYNMISILSGKYRKTKDERILIIGAHWDSATKAPGVDDNGSGSACLLEIARLLSQSRCTFNHTIMLVWFDYEEQGKFGSEFFVNDYLFPLELEKYNSKFIGAYIMDMILVRDKENNTQTLPNSVRNTMPSFVSELEKEKYRGDFLAAWSREQWDEPLETAFMTSWTSLGFESRTFKPMRPKLPQTIPTYDERYKWNDFFRSDHASFWYPALTSSAVRRSPDSRSTVGHYGLKAILLTDLGPWRKSYARCYHSACDDVHLLTDNNLAFMQQVIDSLVITLARVAQGSCAVTRTTNTHSLPNIASNFDGSSIIDSNAANSYGCNKDC